MAKASVKLDSRHGKVHLDIVNDDLALKFPDLKAGDKGNKSIKLEKTDLDAMKRELDQRSKKLDETALKRGGYDNLSPDERQTRIVMGRSLVIIGNHIEDLGQGYSMDVSSREPEVKLRDTRVQVGIEKVTRIGTKSKSKIHRVEVTAEGDDVALYFPELTPKERKFGPVEHTQHKKVKVGREHLHQIKIQLDHTAERIKDEGDEGIVGAEQHRTALDRSRDLLDRELSRDGWRGKANSKDPKIIIRKPGEAKDDTVKEVDSESFADAEVAAKAQWEADMSPIAKMPGVKGPPKSFSQVDDDQKLSEMAYGKAKQEYETEANGELFKDLSIKEQNKRTARWRRGMEKEYAPVREKKEFRKARDSFQKNVRKLEKAVGDPSAKEEWEDVFAPFVSADPNTKEYQQAAKALDGKLKGFYDDIRAVKDAGKRIDDQLGPDEAQKHRVELSDYLESKRAKLADDARKLAKTLARGKGVEVEDPKERAPNADVERAPDPLIDADAPGVKGPGRQEFDNTLTRLEAVPVPGEGKRSWQDVFSPFTEGEREDGDFSRAAKELDKQLVQFDKVKKKIDGFDYDKLDEVSEMDKRLADEAKMDNVTKALQKQAIRVAGKLNAPPEGEAVKMSPKEDFDDALKGLDDIPVPGKEKSWKNAFEPFTEGAPTDNELRMIASLIRGEHQGHKNAMEKARAELGPDAKEDLDRIDEEGKKGVGEFVMSLADLAKTEKGKKEISEDILPLEPLMEDVPRVKTDMPPLEPLMDQPDEKMAA